ncbi:BamA/OMP85 family outer membrane protein [Opitutus terrae]|uniref:Surface antigen (D15) n=1 Tax=Opitutus terrae (strain DSM 11246 / JCM 15787 / PB90-1) TaxID=452637 RepID=B1ZV96_OPITP|nr:BamA/TamA family outer membrane protein [Opitutus terrae]ACB76767.1 surface antigen (D15) [Opitutus terrae PB90-1]
MRNSRLWRVLCVALCAGLLPGLAPILAAERSQEPAKIEVNGLGWLRNREQRRALERLLGAERGATLDAGAIEDAEFLLMSALVEQGFLHPEIQARITTPEGRAETHPFDATLQSSLPRSVRATELNLDVKRGRRYRFDEVRFQGLHAVPDEAAREFFLGERVLIRGGAAQVYSPARLRRSVEGLQNELRRLGYADATVRTDDLRIDDQTGDVDVTVIVDEGARWEVRDVQTAGAADELTTLSLERFEQHPWTHYLEQDIAEAIRNHFYQRGYPDVRVQMRRDARPAAEGVKPVTVIATIAPGARVTIGHVRFEGLQKTVPAVVERRVRATPGEPLNPLALDQARFRLGRLGVFDRVDVRYEPSEGPVRDPVFRVQEGRELEASLLLGYGSYEQLRGGIELRQFNLFGRAHQSRLLLVQSMKSSRGEYSYTVPELFGESLDGTGRVFGLQRQETSFLRQEYGANFSVAAPVRWLGANATLGYTFQSLRNQDNNLATRTADEQQVTAASVELNLVRDRRDNPLRPRRGYRWFVQTETASHYLGGTVDYQRLEFGGSWHRPWGRGRWVHLGLNHGAITTFGSQNNDSDLPVNKRFFPGGDNSIRGFREGEAAPRGADGRFIGAKTYLLLNAEIEQALTAKWSLVVFGDALGMAVRLADYPFAEQLFAVGVGVRYQTLIGPLRMEYGRNLDPRPRDPGGTLLFSVGFPF